jgi:F-type H+-transporting ATPase subunit a
VVAAIGSCLWLHGPGWRVARPVLIAERSTMTGFCVGIRQGSSPGEASRTSRRVLPRVLTLLALAGALACWSIDAEPVLAAAPGVVADQHPEPPHDAASQGAAAPHGEGAAHGLPESAVEVARPFGFPISNSMVVTWIVALALIVFAQAATRKMTEVPGGAQNLMEWLVESLYGFLESIIGPHLVKRTFWFFGTVFIFILAANWLSLLPGVGTIGWGHHTAAGFTVDRPLFRGANADLNMTLAMSLVFFACWIVWALREVGVSGVVHELFAPKGETTGMLRYLMLVVFFAAGCLEIVSILFRPVSLSFRLYGNTFAGENMLEAMATMVPGFGWLLPIPFYFMELLVGLVQAMVFMLLTAVFTLLICQHEEPGHAAVHS